MAQSEPAFAIENTSRDGVDGSENYRKFSLVHAVLRPGQPSLYTPNVSARGFSFLRKGAAIGVRRGVNGHEDSRS
jgi:hypothetical protein